MGWEQLDVVDVNGEVRWSFVRLAVGATTPEGDLRLIDLVALVVGGLRHGRRADDAVDVDDAGAVSANR